MKNKKIIVLILTSILLQFVFGSFLSPIVKADIETYEQQTDRMNPFLFSVDTIYTMTSYDYHMKNDSFHQAILDEDNYYVFYIKSSLVNRNMTVWIQINDASESYFREDCSDGEHNLLMIFKPQKTGLFEIIISNRNYKTSNDLLFHIDEIGILEVPEYTFNYNLDYDRYEVEIQEKWDSDRVVFGIVELENNIKYTITSGYKIHLKHLWDFYLDSHKLNEDLFETQYTDGDIINISARGYYLFYESVGNPFSIYYQEDIDSESNGIFGLGFIGMILICGGIILCISVLILILIYLILRKIKKNKD